MIPEIARYHGVVLRQFVVEAGRSVVVGGVDGKGHAGWFTCDNALVLLKYSTKRLSPWQFTFLPGQLSGLATLRAQHESVWVVCVCGVDGILALSWEEVNILIDVHSADIGWIKAARSRSTQYRVVGSSGALRYRKAMGVKELLASPTADDVRTGDPS